jgi:hypothetical protein
MQSNAFTVTALFAALTAFSAVATTASAGDSDKSKDQASTSSQYSAGASAGGGAGELMGTHKMSGTIEDIDKESGIVDLKTAEGDLKLHFPPQSLANVKEGDQIEVQLGFNPQK